MFHRSWRPVPRPAVSTLIRQYEEITIAASPSHSPPHGLSTSIARSTSRESYIIDSVPEDPSDADDYMIPFTDSTSPVEGPDSPVSPRSRRSLPRMNHSVPAVIVPTRDAPTPDAWSAFGQVSPKSVPAEPTAAEVKAEDARLRRLEAEDETSMQIARRLLRRSVSIVRKIAGKHRIRGHVRPSTRGSGDTFDLRTPKRKLESQPSFKSRAKRVARGTMYSLAHLPENSVDVVGSAAEATTQTAKTIRKSASRTHMRVVSRVEDAKDKVSTSLPIVRPPRSRYSPLSGSPDHYGRSSLQDTHATPGSTPWSLADEVNEPRTSDIIPPPPSPARSRTRNRLQKQRPASYPPGSQYRDSIDPLLGRLPPTDAIFAQALVSDVTWQAQDTECPMIIVTEGADSHEGSWWLPVNSAGQIQLRYMSRSRSPPTPLDSPRSSEDSTSSNAAARSKQWYNGRSSFGSTRSVSASEGNLAGNDDRTHEQVLVSYSDRTPLLVEFLSAEQLENRSMQRSVRARKAMLWAPIGSVLL